MDFELWKTEPWQAARLNGKVQGGAAYSLFYFERKCAAVDRALKTKFAIYSVCFVNLMYMLPAVAGERHGGGVPAGGREHRAAGAHPAQPHQHSGAVGGAGAGTALFAKSSSRRRPWPPALPVGR